jgi:hypothetical protein
VGAAATSLLLASNHRIRLCEDGTVFTDVLLADSGRVVTAGLERGIDLCFAPDDFPTAVQKARLCLGEHSNELSGLISLIVGEKASKRMLKRLLNH